MLSLKKTITNVVVSLSKNRVFRFFARPVWRFFVTKPQIRKRKRAFKKNALEVARLFDKCMIDNNYHYSLIFGSLLGAIREKGFISYDYDIDVALWYDEYSTKLVRLLENNGFKRTDSFMIEDGSLGMEETYEKDGVSIDVFYFYPAIDEYPYCCTFICFEGCATRHMSVQKYGGLLPRRIEMPLSRKLIRTQFETIEMNVPDNAHDVLRVCFGDDYMTPIPNHVPIKEHRTLWYEKIGTYLKY